MGMSVFLGMELCTEESSNDYLLFGVTEDFVYDNPRLYEWSMADVCRLAKRYGILVFQAHPYRAGLMFTPGVLDGVEVCNANPRENSQNHLALAASLEHSLLQSSGLRLSPAGGCWQRRHPDGQASDHGSAIPGHLFVRAAIR